MNKDTSIKLFEQKQVRSIWDEEEEKWYFSVVDVIEVLTDSDRPRKYWSDLKSKLTKEGSELSEKIGQLKIKSTDGKFYKTDVADTEQLFNAYQDERINFKQNREHFSRFELEICSNRFYYFL